jgi:hypothetical protein
MVGGLFEELYVRSTESMDKMAPLGGTLLQYHVPYVDWDDAPAFMDQIFGDSRAPKEKDWI